MIDLEKEREAFEKTCVIDQYIYNVNKNRYDATRLSADNKTFSPLNASWRYWQKRAELAQAEINKEREQATEYYTDCEHLKAEITELKQKLARYENSDYVLVPRRPSILMLSILDKEIKEANIRNSYTQDRLKSIPLVAYKAMILAVEEENAQQDS